MSASADVIVVCMWLAGRMAAEPVDAGSRAWAPEPRENPCEWSLWTFGGGFFAHATMRIDGRLLTIFGCVLDFREKARPCP
jgi:hypothetical protein